MVSTWEEGEEEISPCRFLFFGERCFFDGRGLEPFKRGLGNWDPINTYYIRCNYMGYIDY